MPLELRFPEGTAVSLNKQRIPVEASTRTRHARLPARPHSGLAVRTRGPTRTK